MSDSVLEIWVEDPEDPTGWFPLATPDGHRWLHAETMANEQATLKRVTVSNVYIPGTYTVRSNADNVVRPIGVYLSYRSSRRRNQVKDHLVDLFTRPQYTLMIREGDVTQLVTGCAADYSVNNQREFRHADLTLITFSVSMLPDRRVL